MTTTETKRTKGAKEKDKDKEQKDREASALVGKLGTMEDLSAFVDLKQCTFLNMAARSIPEPVLQPTKSSHGCLASNEDVDCQLLLTVCFKEHVKLQEMCIYSSLPDSAPRQVKLFVNQTSLSFADVERLRPTESLEFKKYDVGAGCGGDGPSMATRMKLKSTAFQNTSSVVVFIENNQDDLDVTWVERIIFYGLPIAGMHVEDIKGAKTSKASTVPNVLNVPPRV